MSIATVTPAEAQRRLAEGTAILVDIREPTEHARESIPGAKLHSLSGLNAGAFDGLRGPGAPAIIFHCQSGARTRDNAGRLEASCGPQALLLEGGLAGWKAAGYPTRIDRSQPLPLQRQVQITAGSLVLLGVILSLLVSPVFVALSAFVGSGLVFAGISGWCGMANLLNVMPWNRQRS